jgi:hypothetical protein
MEVKLGDRYLNKATKEVVKVIDVTAKTIVVLDDNGDELTFSHLAFSVSFKHLDWKEGDVIESDRFIAEFKHFSTYSVAMGVCNWVMDKTTQEDIQFANEIELAYFKKVKEGKRLEVGVVGLQEVTSDNQPKEYDYINPSHYKSGGIEVIDMMLAIWGREKLIAHCEMTAFKYRMRAGTKPDQPIERELEKARWYDEKAKKLRNELS